MVRVGGEQPSLWRGGGRYMCCGGRWEKGGMDVGFALHSSWKRRRVLCKVEKGRQKVRNERGGGQIEAERKGVEENDRDAERGLCLPGFQACPLVP